MKPQWVLTAAAEDFPDWNEGGKVHNWRRHVGEHIQKLWGDIPFEVRVAIALDAEEAAGRESWD